LLNSAAYDRSIFNLLRFASFNLCDRGFMRARGNIPGPEPHSFPKCAVAYRRAF
jgi:hypothetical protein